MKLSKCGFLVSFAVGTAFCCLPPKNIEGVAFTSGELINLDKLKSKGIENVNYLSDSTSAVRYISHYSNDAMVFIGRYGLSYQSGTILDCMGIILDESKLSGTGDITSDIFDFAQAVKTELQWLRQQEVITVSETLIDSVFNTLSNTANGGVQYWTLQKATLGYNSWYEKDTLTGTWSNSGVDGVNSVRSVKGGCSSIKTEFGLPPQQFATTMVKLTSVKPVAVSKVTYNGSSSIRVQSPHAQNGLTKVYLVTISGKTCPVSVVKTASQDFIIPLSGVKTSGMYYVVALHGAMQSRIPVMVIK